MCACKHNPSETRLGQSVSAHTWHPYSKQMQDLYMLKMIRQKCQIRSDIHWSRVKIVLTNVRTFYICSDIYQKWLDIISMITIVTPYTGKFGRGKIGEFGKLWAICQNFSSPMAFTCMVCQNFPMYGSCNLCLIKLSQAASTCKCFTVTWHTAIDLRSHYSE